jgi:maltooligosyltrehalose synthase
MSDVRTAADYMSLKVEGPLRRHVVAFGRSSAAGWVVIVGTRFAELFSDLPVAMLRS